MEVCKLPVGAFAANCYILSSGKDAAVIDPGECTDALLDHLRQNDLTLTHILLTHGHADHITGAPALQKATGAPICIHTDDAAACTDCARSLADECGYARVCFTPDILLHEGDRIAVGTDTLTVLHTPGHTPGGVCFLDAANRLLFSGDTLFCMTAGRTDLPGGDTWTLLRSLCRLRDLEGDYRVFPGHERTTTLDAERKRNLYIRKLG